MSGACCIAQRAASEASQLGVPPRIGMLDVGCERYWLDTLSGRVVARSRPDHFVPVPAGPIPSRAKQSLAMMRFAQARSAYRRIEEVERESNTPPRAFCSLRWQNGSDLKGVQDCVHMPHPCSPRRFRALDGARVNVTSTVSPMSPTPLTPRLTPAPPQAPSSPSVPLPVPGAGPHSRPG